MLNRFKERKPSAGFTLVELVIVIVALGILAAYAAIGFVTPAEATLRSEAEQFARDIRHLQMLAATSGQHLQLGVAGGSAGSYSVSCIGGPAGCSSPANFSVTLRSATISGPALLDFDSLGRPLAVGGAVSTTASPYTLTAGSPPGIAVTVSPVTGFVAVTPP